VLVQTGAGAGIGSSDEEYVAAGAEIAPDAAKVFADSEMIVKVKEPQEVEWKQLRADQLLFTYLHLAPDPAQTIGLMESGCTAIAYETVTDNAGGLPLLAPMSEVAGRLSVIEGGYYLKRTAGGRGVLLSGVPGVEPANIVVIGGGVVGTNAAKLALGMGSRVTILTVQCRVCAIWMTFSQVRRLPAILPPKRLKKALPPRIWWLVRFSFRGRPRRVWCAATIWA
jgi:alanine dehydrogenase